MKKCLTRLVFDEPYKPLRRIVKPWKARLVRELQQRLAKRRMEVVLQVRHRRARETGLDWPPTAKR